MSFKQRTEYLQALNEMYKNISSQLHTVWNFNPWPLVRIQTGYFFHLMFAKAANGASSKAPSAISYKRSTFSLRDLARIVKVYGSLFAFAGKNRNLRNQLLLVGYYEHQSKDNGNEINIYINPVKDEFDKQNIANGILWLSNKNESLKQFPLSRLYNTLYSLHMLIFKVSMVFSKDDRLAFENANMVKEWLIEENLVQQDDATTIVRQLYNAQKEQQIRYKTSRHFLRITRPKGIWTYCYYDNNIMALVRAANDLKIPTLEYQHSVQSDSHFAYTKWPDIDKYERFFPRKYWVWRDADKKMLESNFTGDRYRPNVVPGGNIYLAQKKDEVKISEGIPESTSVLVSLQGMWIPSFVERFIESTAGYVWYFRLHPRYPGDKLHLQHMQSKFPDKINIEEANSLSLYQLFSRVQYNLTGFSGTALEAHAFGIRNIIFNEEGYASYKEYIENMNFDYVTNEEELSKSLISSYDNADTNADLVLNNIELVRHYLKDFVA